MTWPPAQECTTLGGGKGRDRDSPRRRLQSLSRKHTPFYSTWGSYTFVLNETPPKCDEQKPSVAPAHLVVPADDELQVAHELPEGFVLGEQVLCARGDVLLVLEVQVLDLSQHCHQLRRVKRTEAVRSHGTGLGSICAGLSLGGFCSPQGEPRGRPTWGTGSAGRIRMLPSSSSVHDPLTCPRLSLRYRSPPPHV